MISKTVFRSSFGAGVATHGICAEKDERFLKMNARMKLVTREHAALFLISAEAAGGGGSLQAGTWTSLQKKLKRMLLLLRSPIVSFRWAWAKHKALVKLKQNAVSGWQGRRSNSFAECERDGILMGF
jgi:hypothetical protein